MPAIQGLTRTAFLCFFASHIPITLLIDCQAFLPRHFYPQALQDVVDWYAETFKDKLMQHPTETWFSSLVAIEALFQLPFFFLAVYAILQHHNGAANKAKHALIRGDGIFRSLCLIYGSSTATTMAPILSCVLTDEDTTAGEKGMLLGFYVPYLIFPMWLVIIAVCEDNVFGTTYRSATKKKKKT